MANRNRSEKIDKKNKFSERALPRRNIYSPDREKPRPGPTSTLQRSCQTGFEEHQRQLDDHHHVATTTTIQKRAQRRGPAWPTATDHRQLKLHQQQQSTVATTTAATTTTGDVTAIDARQ